MLDGISRWVWRPRVESLRLFDHDQPDTHWHTAFWRDTTDCLFLVRLTEQGEFRYESINPALETLSGLPNAAVTRKTPDDLLLPAESAATILKYRTCCEVGQSIRYEHSMTFRTGTYQLDTCLSPLRNPVTGKIDRLLGSCRDITEQKTATKALESSEAMFRALAHTAPGIIFIVGRGGAIEYANPQFSDYTGAENGRLLSDHYLSYVHPDDASFLSTLRWRGLVTEKPFEVECRLRAADGSYHWFLVRSRSLGEEDQKRWFGIATNIDDVKKSSIELATSNVHLENILSGISDCYFTIDRQWNCTRINDRAREWFGMSFGDVDSSRLRALCETDPALFEAIQDTLARGMAFRREWRPTFYPDRWIAIYVCGTSEGASVFFHDITDRKRAQQNIEQARELLQSSLDAVPARIAIVDSLGTIFSVNRAWRNATERGGQLGRQFSDICEPSEVREAFLDILAGTNDAFQLTYSVTSAAKPVWYRCSIVRFGSGDRSWVIVIYDDVTQVVRAEQRAEDLSAKLLTLQEEERQQIAGDLHDSTSHHLVAANLTMMRVRTLEKGAAELDGLYSDIEGLLEQALKEIRTFTYLLYPRNLDSDKLKRTVERFVEGLRARASLRMETVIDDEVDHLPLTLQRTIVRVIQEAVSNIHRHAAATEARIVLEIVGSRLRLTIRDNGKGMAKESADDENASFGVGIPGMRARLGQYGGVLDIESGATGTTIRAKIPLVPANED